MTLQNGGLNKLIEECGELIQIACKAIVADEDGLGDTHYDGLSVKERLEDEIADVIGAATFIMQFRGLNTDRVEARTLKKIQLFGKWSQE